MISTMRRVRARVTFSSFVLCWTVLSLEVSVWALNVKLGLSWGRVFNEGPYEWGQAGPSFMLAPVLALFPARSRGIVTSVGGRRGWEALVVPFFHRGGGRDSSVPKREPQCLSFALRQLPKGSLHRWTGHLG